MIRLCLMGLSLFLVLPPFAGRGQNDGRLRDSLALVALYNSTNGPGWFNTWDLNRPLDTWFGVHLNAEGSVVCLDMHANPDCYTFFDEPGNNLSGPLPPEIGNLKELRDLHLNNNQITGVIPPQIGNLKNLQYLFLSGNQLSGYIPESLGECRSLRQLELNYNRFYGSIPASLGNLSDLQELILDNNSFDGLLPPELGNLGYLQVLIVADNKLEGPVPESLGNLSNLRILSLGNNQLTASLPSGLGNLSQLEVLSLSNNQFFGLLPASLGQLNRLYYLDLSGNDFRECIPDSYALFCSIGDRLSGSYGNRQGFNTVNFSGNYGLPGQGDFSAFCSQGRGACTKLPASEPLPVRLIRDDDLRGGGTYSWSADTIYLLDGVVCLEEGGRLDIEPGTIVKGKQRPGAPAAASALVIAQGARIYAVGAPSRPIIFTAEADNTQLLSDLSHHDRGLWGGLVILGKARLSGPATSRFFPGLTGPLKSYGGQDDADNSGILRYVSIRHAGAAPAGTLLPGLNLAGVGRGTQLDYVEVFAAADDGLRVWGGAAAVNYSVLAFCNGDQIEWDQGWRGGGHNWLSVQDDPAGYAVNARGGGAAGELFSNPAISAATFIGPGRRAENGPPVAVFFQENSGGTIANSIFIDYPERAIEVEDRSAGIPDSYRQAEQGNIRLLSSYWRDFGAGWLLDASPHGIIQVSPGAENPTAPAVTRILVEGNNRITDPNLRSISRTPDRRLDPGRSFCPNPAGAFQLYLDFSGADWWISTWTALETYQFTPTCGIDLKIELPDGRDTIPISCGELRQLWQRIDSLNNDFEIFCPKGCDFEPEGIRTAVVRRSRVQKRPKSDEEFCYIEEWTWPRFYYSANSDNPVDTQYITKVFLVSDTDPPKLTFVPNPGGKFAFDVLVEDCDTAWVSDFRQDTVFREGRLWVVLNVMAQDYCGNTTVDSVLADLSAEVNTWYLDFDGDGFGDPGETVDWPSRPPGFVDNALDCDDRNAGSFPGNFENDQNAIDDDCDGSGAFDDCEEARELMVGQSYSLSFKGSTLSAGLPEVDCVDGLAVRKDVWFTFEAPPSGDVAIEVTHYDGNPVVELYQGDCGSLDLLDCIGFVANYSTSKRIDHLVPGVTYYLRLGQIIIKDAFSIEIRELISPPNDYCANAMQLPLSAPDAPFQTFDPGEAHFSKEVALPSDCLSPIESMDYFAEYGGDVWFHTFAPPSGNLVLEGAERLRMALYSGECGNLVPLDCGEKNIIVRNLPPGRKLYIRIFAIGSRSFKLRSYEGEIPFFPNDLCEQAVELPVTPVCQAQRLPLGRQASVSPLNIDADPFCVSTGQDIWFTLVIPASGNVAVDFAGYPGFSVQFFSGACGDLQLLNCTGNTLINRPPGQRIYVRVSGNFNENLDQQFSICAYEFPPPNNSCLNARALPVGNCLDYESFSNLGATLTPGMEAFSCAGPADGREINDVWFSIRIPDSGQLDVNLSWEYGYVLQLFSGSCSELALMACSYSSQLSQSGLTPGETMLLRVARTTETFESGQPSSSFAICARDPEAPEPLIGLTGYYSFCDCQAANNLNLAEGLPGGVLTGNPACVPGARGDGLLFNQQPEAGGCPEGMTIAVPPDSYWNQGFTFAAWVRFDAPDAGQTLFQFSQADGSAPLRFGIEGANGDLTLINRVDTTEVFNRLTAPGAANKGKLSHYVVTARSGFLHVYIDGKLAARQSGFSLAVPPRNLITIGKGPGCEEQTGFRGMMDEIRIYNRELSRYDIESLFQRTSFKSENAELILCSDDFGQLLSGGEGISYLWDPPSYALGSNPRNRDMYIQLDTTTVFTLEVTLPDNCLVKDSITVRLNNDSDTVVAAVICQGETLEGYEESGTYLDYFISSNGCDSIRTLDLTVLPELIFEVSALPATGGAANGSAAIDTAGLNDIIVSVEWSTGDTGRVVAGLVPGTYSVTVTGAATCPATRSFTVETITSVGELYRPIFFELFPNPARERLNVNVAFPRQESGLLSVQDILGRTILQRTLRGSQWETAIDMQGWEPGMYLIVIQFSEGRQAKSFIKN